MNAIDKDSQKVFDKLVAGLAEPGEKGAYRKVDDGGAGIMAVHVEHYAPAVYSIAHTYIQNGDVMDDPSMLFWLNPRDGRAYPFTFTQHSLGMDQESAEFVGGAPVRFAPRLQREHATFASQWLRNIKQQQGL